MIAQNDPRTTSSLQRVHRITFRRSMPKAITSVQWSRLKKSGRVKGGDGLGKGSANCHRKVLRDSIQGITKPAIRRLDCTRDHHSQRMYRSPRMRDYHVHWDNIRSFINTLEAQHSCRIQSCNASRTLRIAPRTHCVSDVGSVIY